MRKQNKRDIKKNRTKLQQKSKTNQGNKTFSMMQTFVQEESSVKSFNNDDEFNSYVNGLRNEVKTQWNQTLEIMSGFNVDLSNSFDTILDTTYKSLQTNRKVRLTMFDDENAIDIFNKKYNKSADVILQLWDVKTYKSLILLLNIREDADVNWRGDRLPLSKQEKVLTSWMLDTSDGITGHPFYVVDDVVKSVADKNLFSNVYSVLD
jgi:hypothetical protein